MIRVRIMPDRNMNVEIHKKEVTAMINVDPPQPLELGSDPRFTRIVAINHAIGFLGVKKERAKKTIPCRPLHSVQSVSHTDAVRARSTQFAWSTIIKQEERHIVTIPFIIIQRPQMGQIIARRLFRHVGSHKSSDFKALFLTPDPSLRGSILLFPLCFPYHSLALRIVNFERGVIPACRSRMLSPQPSD